MELTLNGQLVTVRRIVDLPDERLVRAFMPEIGSVELWEADAYDEKGDWTYEDVTNRIVELLDEGGNAP